MATGKKPEPLPISCTTTDCAHNLHCFREATKNSKFARGLCAECGADLVDWDRIHLRDLRDVENTFAHLKREWIRHHYFHRAIDQHASNYAHRKGRSKLMEATRKRLQSAIQPAQPFRDGNQTSYEGNPIYYAQHATACCCRKCLEYWHGIPMGSELTEEELNYCLGLINLYYQMRFPDLADAPKQVPPIRKAQSKGNGAKPDDSE